ncbi:MAG: HAD family hydrolase [Clostridiales bacterium]|nr:HAD family hydrolase [Clostridiales bacterium]
MRKYKYLLFDLDGTLIYSHMGIWNCFRYAMQEMGYPEPQEEDLKKCIGPSLEYSFATFFGMDEASAKKATAKYREQYKVTGVWENEPIEGALEALKSLKEAGYIMALATSKPLVFAEKISARWGFAPYLAAEIGCGIDGSLPTKADVVREAMKQLNAKAEECLMVGDRFYDVEGARACGVDCAMLRVGYAPEEEYEACNPAYVFKNFEELVNFLVKCE